MNSYSKVNKTSEQPADAGKSHWLDSLRRWREIHIKEKTFVATTHEEFLDIAANKPGFIKAMWCGDSACEDQLKDETGGVKSRCIPFVEEQLSDKCVCCGKPAKHMVYWGRQY